MEFLVEFDIRVPGGTPEAEVEQRISAEAAALAGLGSRGAPGAAVAAAGGTRREEGLGLYRADGEAQLDGLLGALPLNGWMRISVTPLEPHPNDPSSSSYRILCPLIRSRAPRSVREEISWSRTDRRN